MLLYIFWCCDLTPYNPFREVDFREKEKQAMVRAFHGLKITEFDADQRLLIDNGITAYNYFNETSIERAVIAYDNKIDEVRSALNEIQPRVVEVFDQTSTFYYFDDMGNGLNGLTSISVNDGTETAFMYEYEYADNQIAKIKRIKYDFFGTRNYYN